MPSITTSRFSGTVVSAAGTAITLASTSGLYPGLYGNIIGSGGSPAGTKIRISAVTSTTVIQAILAPESGFVPQTNMVADFSAYAGGTVYFEPQVVSVDSTIQDSDSNVGPADAIPSQNSTANAYPADVIGNKTDNALGNSLYSLAYKIHKHLHTASVVRPTMAAGVTVTKDAAAWTLGSFATIIPTGSVTAPFDIHSINFDSISANGTFEIVLYAGADGAEAEICRTRFTRTTAADIANDSPVMTAVQPANTQIKAKLAGSSSGADNVVISLRLHSY